MGISPFSHWNDDDWSGSGDYSDKQQDSNPDPSNFTIKKIKKIGDYLWVLVNYPNCLEYRGDKILVFYKIKKEDFLKWKLLDPHFSEIGRSPIARFRPNTIGTLLSLKLCKLKM